MIEVEKKFQPTKEQVESLLKEAEFLGEKKNHDVYYDYSDFRLLKKDTRLRNRNGNFELKIKLDSDADLEVEDEEKIKKYFETDLDLKIFVKNNLNIIIDFETDRLKYKIDEFTIDVDKLSFGYEICEIELMVEKEEQIEEARKKIKELAKNYNFNIKKPTPKGWEYLRRFNNKVFQEIYKN